MCYNCNKTNTNCIISIIYMHTQAAKMKKEDTNIKSSEVILHHYWGKISTKKYLSLKRILFSHYSTEYGQLEEKLML